MGARDGSLTGTQWLFLPWFNRAARLSVSQSAPSSWAIVAHFGASHPLLVGYTVRNPLDGPPPFDQESNMQMRRFKQTDYCWICGNAVDLRTCKADEHGMAIHADCYLLASESKRMMVRKPVHRITALWYRISGSGTRTSTP